MEILVVSDSKKLKELLSFQISSYFQTEVKEITSKFAPGVLAENPTPFHLVVLPYSGSDSGLIDILKTKNPNLSAIFYYDPVISEPEPTDFEGVKLLGTVSVGNLIAGTIELIKKKVEAEGLQLDSQEFCPIRTTLLSQVSPLNSDVYLRQAKGRYSKIFSVGDKFGADDLNSYQSRDIEYLYLPRGELNSFVTVFEEELNKMLGKPNVDKKEAMEMVSNTQETVQELILYVGFNEQVQKVAKKNVQLALKAIGKNPKLSSVLSRIQSGEHYIAEHSALLAEVACCVAKEMEWESEITFGKLVLAALMHDVSINNPDLCRINSIAELELRKNDFPINELEIYHLHPMKSAEIVKMFKEIPPDVDIIVAQHHELPDGSGFPNELTHTHFAPLSVVFIIAHDMTQLILENRKTFSLKAFIEKFKSKYELGAFKKVITVLEKANQTDWMPVV